MTCPHYTGRVQSEPFPSPRYGVYSLVMAGRQTETSRSPSMVFTYLPLFIAELFLSMLEEILSICTDVQRPKHKPGEPTVIVLE
jgi:hypothetical protein